jgi:hypothetical protein
MKRLKNLDFVCSQCGKPDIEQKAWVNPNTDEVLDSCSDGDIQDNWCNVCEEHNLFITYKEFKMLNI